jgi:hypothetical protein
VTNLYYRHGVTTQLKNCSMENEFVVALSFPANVISRPCLANRHLCLRCAAGLHPAYPEWQRQQPDIYTVCSNSRRAVTPICSAQILFGCGLTAQPGRGISCTEIVQQCTEAPHKACEHSAQILCQVGTSNTEDTWDFEHPRPAASSLALCTSTPVSY